MATLESAKAKYIEKVKAAQSSNKYAKRMARFLGVSPDEILASAPVQNWNSFDVVQAANSWAKDLKLAFTSR